MLKIAEAIFFLPFSKAWSQHSGLHYDQRKEYQYWLLIVVQYS